MLTAVVAALAATLPAAVSAQVALEGSLDSNLRGDVATGLRGDLFSGIPGNLGDTRRGRPGVNGGLPDTFVREGCAPHQVNIHNTGCQPIEWLSRDSIGTFERSSEALAGLPNLTLDPSPPGVVTGANGGAYGGGEE